MSGLGANSSQQTPKTSDSISFPAITSQPRSPSVTNQRNSILGAVSQKSPENYKFQISPSGYKRRVNKDGTQMLEAILQNQQTQKNVKLLENRIKRLEYQDHRANKKIQETQRKTQQMLRVKQRRKQNRQKFIAERDRRTNSIQKTMNDLKMHNNSIKTQILDNRKKNNQALHKFVQDEREKKYQMRLKQLEEKRMKRESMINSQSQKNQELFNQFNSRASSNRYHARYNVDFMRQLQEREQALLQKLKHTFAKQQNSFHSFEAVANSSIQASGRASLSTYGNGGFLDRGVSSAKGGKKLVSINIGKADLRKSTDDAGLNQSYNGEADNSSLMSPQGKIMENVEDRLEKLVEAESNLQGQLKQLQALLQIGGVSLLAQKKQQDEVFNHARVSQKTNQNNNSLRIENKAQAQQSIVSHLKNDNEEIISKNQPPQQKKISGVQEDKAQENNERQLPASQREVLQNEQV